MRKSTPTCYLPNYPLQSLFVILIISILVFIAIQSYRLAFYKARMVKSFAVVNILKQEIATYYANKGEWPNSVDLKEVLTFQSEGIDVSGVEIKDGSIRIPVYPKGKNWSPLYIAFNRVVLAPENQFSIVWSCASNDKLGGFPIDMQFKSTVAGNQLFSVCK